MLSRTTVLNRVVDTRILATWITSVYCLYYNIVLYCLFVQVNKPWDFVGCYNLAVEATDRWCTSNEASSFEAAAVRNAIPDHISGAVPVHIVN
jgi:hypothetical protein